MGADEAVRLLMVKREAGVPDSEGGSVRWAVDHLLLDQHGIPTLVEVKRSSDTRIRREVVGQLLEYAANIDVYWPSDRIRSLATEQHRGSEGLDRAILELLQLDPEDDAGRDCQPQWQLMLVSDDSYQGLQPPCLQRLSQNLGCTKGRYEHIRKDDALER